jgi:hypothetical protein
LFIERQKVLAKEKGTIKTKIKKSDIIRAKIRVFARLNYMTTVLRKNSELVTAIKALNPTGKLDRGILAGG